MDIWKSLDGMVEAELTQRGTGRRRWKQPMPGASRFMT